MSPSAHEILPNIAPPQKVTVELHQMGVCKKTRPFNHIFGADRILEQDIEASKMQGRARGRKGERKT